VEAHAEDLRAEVQDREGGEELVAAIKVDHRTAKLPPAEMAMLDYAVKLTLAPSQMRASDVDRLRDHGFVDVQIHDIVQVVGFFAFYNRLADGLGVDPEPEWGWPGRTPHGD
jgi:uncharacterized peroxidase-related enzyme